MSCDIFTDREVIKLMDYNSEKNVIRDLGPFSPNYPQGLNYVDRGP